MKRDRLNDQHLDLIEKQRLYFKTVKEFKEVFIGTIIQILLYFDKYYSNLKKKQVIFSYL